MRTMKNEEGVSPVIGVILMVVITVIIAAILAVFAFGIGGPTKAPSANLRYSANTTNLTITHEGGDPLTLKDEYISILENDVPIVNNVQMTAWQATSALAVNGKVLGGLNGTTQSVGDVLTVRIVDQPSGQIISNVKVAVVS